jgi:hypothetical protein
VGALDVDAERRNAAHAAAAERLHTLMGIVECSGYQPGTKYNYVKYGLVKYGLLCEPAFWTENTCSKMGKNRHSKDRLFVTQTEHKYLYGGKKAEIKRAYRRAFE